MLFQAWSMHITKRGMFQSEGRLTANEEMDEKWRIMNTSRLSGTHHHISSDTIALRILL